MVSPAGVVTRRAKLRTVDRSVGRRMHHGRDVDAQSDNARQHGAAPTAADLSTVRVGDARGLAGRRKPGSVRETRASARTETQGEGAIEAVRTRPVRLGSSRQAPHDGPETTDRRRHRAESRLLLDGSDAARSRTNVVDAHDVNVRVSRAAETPRHEPSRRAETDAAGEPGPTFRARLLSGCVVDVAA